MKLSKGNTIGYISPSSPVTATSPKRYERAKSFLEKKGFVLKAGKLTGRKDYYRSGSISARVEELNELIQDKEVKCIISTIGGMNSNSLLPYIDYKSFKKDPKIIIGYSDMTAILWGIYEKTGMTTYYGPALVATFGELEPFNEMSFKYFEDIIIRNQKPYKLEKPEIWTEEYINWETQKHAKEKLANNWKTIRSGYIEGRVLIGNLSTITGIWGSSYCPEIKEGDILFIEDSLKDATTVERLFSFLKIHNVFKKIGGLILGKHELFNDQGTGRKPYEILSEVIGDYSFPFLADVDCCHTHPMFTIPIGSKIALDATKQEITII